MISVHCHNDLGLAVANSLAAVRGGRRPGRMHHQRHRRAGRQLRARRGRHGRAHPQRLLQLHDRHQHRSGSCPTSRLVSHVTGIQVQRNKAIVGQNAFAHEAGIHQDGMLKERTHLRDHAARGRRLATDRAGAGQAQRPARPAPARPRRWAITSTTSSCRTVFEQFKVLADKKKEIYDADIAALIEQEIREVPETWTVAGYRLVAEMGGVPTVTLTLRRNDEEFSEEVSMGDGPFDAMFHAVERITGVEVVCRDFNVHSVTIGKDAQAEVTVEVEHGGRIYRGRGVSTDSPGQRASVFKRGQPRHGPPRTRRQSSRAEGGRERVNRTLAYRRMATKNTKRHKKKAPVVAASLVATAFFVVFVAGTFRGACQTRVRLSYKIGAAHALVRVPARRTATGIF